jgi:hypothetical protein
MRGALCDVQLSSAVVGACAAALLAAALLAALAIELPEPTHLSLTPHDVQLDAAPQL